jgi:tetratricopeptide (TPR) repeat protein
LGHAAYGRGEYPRARQYYEESLALFEEVGHVWVVGRLRTHLGDTALAVKDYDQAREHHQRALTCYQDAGAYWVDERVLVGGCWGVPVSLQTLGDIALMMGDVDLARQRYREALEGASDHPGEELRLHLMLGPARLCAQEEDPGRGVELAALARHHPASVEETREKAGELLRGLQAKLPPDAYAAAESRGQARDLVATVQELLIKLGEE